MLRLSVWLSWSLLCSLFDLTSISLALYSVLKTSAVYILFAFTSLTLSGDKHNMLLLLDALTPERFLGLYTDEKSEVDILTFFLLDMATGRRIWSTFVRCEYGSHDACTSDVVWVLSMCRDWL